MTKAYKNWKRVIESKEKYQNAPWSEHEIIYFRKAIGMAGLKSEDERASLKSYFFDSMPDTGYNITTEHQKKGIDYLRANTYKKNGQLRKNNIFKEFELEVINNFSHFKFLGLKRQGFSDYYLPLYECVANNGDSFTYTGTCYSMIQVTEVYTKMLRAV